MTGRLFYFIGPSGAGKDSLLNWVKSHAPTPLAVHLARRTITRPLHAGEEDHDSVDARAFALLCEAQAFALDWQANGLRYGVRHDELSPIHRGAWVLVNGSRAYLPEARARFPEMIVVHVSAGAETLRRRLTARARESADMVEQRVHRAGQFAPPTEAIQVRNDGALEEAGERMLQDMRNRAAEDIRAEGSR
ncbi:MAG: phosphonate metabolism protein/1,5-bisphosphokinase (PRPP-forming) PhnN [Gammaproteobacteria bacterium]|nr:phosphonate metabolism protein/1,5-bisphosphokinase (PRPP-forming) PhnN [Gammaproteobacteria bacterium]